MAHNEPLEVVYFEVQPNASPPLPKYFSNSSSRAYSSSPRQTSSAVMSFVTGVGSFVIHYAVKKKFREFGVKDKLFPLQKVAVINNILLIVVSAVFTNKFRRVQVGGSRHGAALRLSAVLVHPVDGAGYLDTFCFRVVRLPVCTGVSTCAPRRAILQDSDRLPSTRSFSLTVALGRCLFRLHCSTS